MIRYALIIFFIAALASCKDSPILVKAGLHDDGKKKTLFTIETIYTVTSKKSGGGFTSRSGYTTCFLNAVDVKTGENLQRKKIGDFKDRIEFMGSLGNKAWFYSYDPAIGLHTRNPATLEVEQSTKDIIAKNPDLSVGLTELGYQTDIDSSGKYIFTTTKDGYNYLIDPVTLVATKTDDKANRRHYLSGDRTTASGDCTINDSLSFQFSGSPRAILQVTTKKFNKESFDFFSRNQKNIPSKNLYYRQAAFTKFDNISFIDPKVLINITGSCSNENRNPVLHDDDNYFVVSKNMLGNSFNWIISSVKIKYDTAQPLWTSTIGNTEKVNYSDKDLLSASIADEKLLLVFENVMIAFNKKTGTLIWRKDIRKESD